VPIARYRTKPVIVEAWWVTDEETYDIANWTGASVLLDGDIQVLMVPVGPGLVATYPGDYIIRFPDGTYDVKRPDGMAAVYESYEAPLIEELPEV
jgi:hypothetical protein